MNFVLKQAGENGARRGVLSGFERLPSLQIETPNVLLYTQGGSVPHLTPDVLEYLSPAPQALVIPIPSISALEGRMKKCQMNVAEFVGLKHLATIATIMDPGKARLEGFHKTDILAVQTRSGKKEYTAESYMDFIESLKPDIFTALCDGDTNTSSSIKRVAKSSSRSQAMLAHCVQRWKESTVLKSSQFLAPLEGGVKPETRKLYAEEVQKTSYGVGIVIDGLGQYGEVVVKRDVEDVSDAIRASLEPTSKEKLRILLGPWHPRAIFSLIELGIDLFDTSYPYLVTERGCALLLTAQPSELSKKPKPNHIELNLHETINAECFEPISDNCTCLACKNHTRAYIHHLLNVKEMLASVLLSIHNLQQYLQFFSSLRQSIENGTFLTLKKSFQ